MSPNDDPKILVPDPSPWEAAKQKFLEDLSPEDRAVYTKWLGEGDSTERLQKEVENLETKNQMMGEKTKRLLKGLSALDSVISPIAGLDQHGIAVMLWGSAKVFITLATTAIEFLASISEFIEDIGRQLGLFDDYKHLYSKHGSQRFNASLQQVFSCYLYFCSTARDFFKSSKFKRLREATKFSRHKTSSHVDTAKAALEVACSRAKAEIDLVEKQSQARANRNMLDGVLQVDEHIRNLQLGIEQGFGEIGEKLTDAAYSGFLGWLAVPNLDVEAELKTNIRKRASLPSTCTWIFTDPALQKWVSSTSTLNRAHWIKADAGFGKSVLTSYIITEVQELYPTGVVYFFCKHDDQEKSSISSLLRSWTWQLLKTQFIGGENVGSHLAITPNVIVGYKNRGVS